MPNPTNLEGQGFHTNPERINKKGRPKLPDLRAAVAAILADEKDGKTALDAILMALRSKAVKGDIRAAQELLDRGYGKARQSIDFAGDNLTKLTIEISGGTDKNE